MIRDLPKGVYLIAGREGFRAVIWPGNKVKQVGVFADAREAAYKRLIAEQGHHWEGVPLDPKNYWGFIYCITNRDTDKMYIGKKQFRLWDGPPGGYKCTDPTDTEWFDESAWKRNDWEFYTGSSKSLSADMFNPWDWKFEVLKLSKDKLENHLDEVNEQISRNVLEALDADGKYLYYNENIASLEFRAPFLKSDMVAKREVSLETMRNYYLRPSLCPKCKEVLTFPGTGGCTSCS